MGDTTHYIRTKQLAEFLGLSIAAIERWRQLGKGPRWTYLGSSRVVAYSRSDVDAWLRAQREATERTAVTAA